MAFIFNYYSIVGSLWLSLVLLLIAVPQLHSQSQFPVTIRSALKATLSPATFSFFLSLALSSLFSSFSFYCEWLLVLLFTSLFPFYAFRLRYCCFSLWLLFAADTQHTHTQRQIHRESRIDSDTICVCRGARLGDFVSGYTARSRSRSRFWSQAPVTVSADDNNDDDGGASSRHRHLAK